jgi:hypothetical protein
MSQMSLLPVLTTPDPSTFPRERQAAFLAALAASGNVRSASARVGVSHQTAYRARLASPGFRRAWDAALLAARAQAEEVLANRALEGWEEDVLYHGEVVATRRRYSDRLLLAHLARLDKLCADAEVAQFADSFDLALARYAAGEDRPAAQGASTGSARAELGEDGKGDFSSSGLWSMRSTPPSALRQAQGEREELPPPLPEVRERGEVLGEAAQLDVGLYDLWWDEEGERWLTSWPAPEHFAGEELAIDADSGEVAGSWPVPDEGVLAPRVGWARTLTAEEQAGLDRAEARSAAHRAARLALYQRAAFGLASAAEAASIAAANDGDLRWAGPGGQR